VSGVVLGSFAAAEGRLEVQVPRDCLHPSLISKGRAPMDTVANGLEFRGGQRPVDLLGPTRLTSPACKAFRSTYRQTNKK
jgi:hypothetical protein